jgi:hypothetical protein
MKITVLLNLIFVAALSAQSRLSVHGHLSQAYAFTDGTEFLGIPKNGTTDYRNLALQFGYDMTDNTRLIIQLGHKRLGTSPTMAFRDELEVDWAFVDYWLLDNVALKAGKVQLSMGIFNEIRDVGTLLPFYRVPFYTYNEGWWTSATVDGLVMSAYLRRSEPWNLEVHSFYGGWSLAELEGLLPSSARAEDGLGVQVWLNTAIPGLRFGLEGHRVSFEGTNPDPNSSTSTTWTASIDGSFDRVIAQAEYISNGFRTGSWCGYYARLGARLTDRLTINGLGDFGKLDLDMTLQSVTYHVELDNKDYALSLNYRLQSYLVLKFEHHWTKGISNPQNIFETPEDVRYGILSFSASF